MKKFLCLISVLLLLAATPALAESDLTGRPIADGSVAAVRFTDVTAPFSGTLTSFDLEPGDAVQAGDTLMRYLTADVYAGEDGVVKAVFAAPGEDAATVAARYGALMAIEPAVAFRVDASTSGAYDDNDNKMLHPGETLYFKTSETNGAKGLGRVVQVTGDKYVVDVLSGDFDLNDDVTLYRRDNYAKDANVGKGNIIRRDAVLVTGAGRVSALYVAEGDKVAAGDRLFSLIAADATPDAYASDVTAGVSGVVSSVSVMPGQQVFKGQALCRIQQTDAMEVVADVDEVDLGTLKVGDLLPVTLDVQPDNVLMATVTQISALGVKKQNAAYFTVHAAIPSGNALLGMSASLYLPAK